MSKDKPGVIEDPTERRQLHLIAQGLFLLLAGAIYWGQSQEIEMATGIIKDSENFVDRFQLIAGMLIINMAGHLVLRQVPYIKRFFNGARNIDEDIT